MAFKVKVIEFDCPKVPEENKECLATWFVEIAEILYMPKIKSNSEIELKEKRTTIKFKRPISLNTVNNILLQFFDRQRSVKIDEVEYKSSKKKVEIEVEVK